MKKQSVKVMEKLARYVKKSAIQSCGMTSVRDFYQPNEPKCVKKLFEKQQKN